MIWLQGSLDAARRAAGFVRGDDVIHKIFTEFAYRYKWIFQPSPFLSNLFLSTLSHELYLMCWNRDRAGGYTRMLRTRIRVGDAAPMAYIESVNNSLFLFLQTSHCELTCSSTGLSIERMSWDNRTHQHLSRHNECRLTHGLDPVSWGSTRHQRRRKILIPIFKQ